MTAGAKCYADYQNEQTLVPVNIWCRPQDMNAILDYAASLVRGESPGEPRSQGAHREAGDPFADLLRRAVLMAQSNGDADVRKATARCGDKTKQQRARIVERFKSRPDEDSPGNFRAVDPPVPRVVNDDPAQLRRVIQYHHPDKSNPGADPVLFAKARERLAQLRVKQGS